MSIFNLVSLVFLVILGIIMGIGYGIFVYYIDLLMFIVE